MISRTVISRTVISRKVISRTVISNTVIFQSVISQTVISQTVISQTVMSQIVISQSTLLYQRHMSYFIFILAFKLLISQSKFSGTRKFTLKYQLFGINFDFEISIVDCSLFKRRSHLKKDSKSKGEF